MDITTFAKIVKVSEATVSRAFSGKGKVKDSTKQHIFKKAQELGYRPNGYLATNNMPFAKETVVFLHFTQATLNTDYLFNELFEGIKSVIDHTEYTITPHVLIENTPALKDFYYDVFRAANVKGIIASSETNSYQELKEKLEYWGKPFVLIGNNNPDNFNNIGFNVYEGGRTIGAYFKKNKRQKAACIVGSYYSHELVNITLSPKRNGFLEGFNKKPEDICWVPGGCTFLDGYNAFHAMRRMDQDIDCVFCENDILAIGFIRAAVESGVKIPEDICVIGFDNIDAGKFITPSLSTIDFPRYQMGQAAANGIIDMVNKKTSQINLNLTCDLIIRDSA